MVMNRFNCLVITLKQRNKWVLQNIRKKTARPSCACSRTSLTLPQEEEIKNCALQGKGLLKEKAGKEKGKPEHLLSNAWVAPSRAALFKRKQGVEAYNTTEAVENKVQAIRRHQCKPEILCYKAGCVSTATPRPFLAQNIPNKCN